MSLISLSTNQITFESNDSFKTVQMINVGTSEINRKPIMYKIKTNKIDYVDAKPSCGYISGLKGQNEINVIIRSLTNKKEFNAKLQILYVSHEKITEELVEKNKKHFDLIEYNELYDSIKQGNQNDVKTAIINVSRKGVDSAEDAPIDPHSDSKSKMKIAELSQSIKDKAINKSDSIPTEKKKGSLKNSLVLLMIGLLIGFLLGSKYGGKLGLFNEHSLVKTEASETYEGEQENIVEETQEENDVNKKESKEEEVNDKNQEEEIIEPEESIESEEKEDSEEVLEKNEQEINEEQASPEENDETEETVEVENVHEILVESIQESLTETEEDMINQEEPQEESVIISIDQENL